MKHCNPDSLSHFLDGDLSWNERGAVVAHLRACPNCRDELDALRAVDRVVSAWSARSQAVSAQTERRIVAAVERRRRLSPLIALSRMTPAAVGSTIAAVLVVLSVNVGLMTHSVPVSPVTPQTSSRPGWPSPRVIYTRHMAPLLAQAPPARPHFPARRPLPPS